MPATPIGTLSCQHFADVFFVPGTSGGSGGKAQSRNPQADRILGQMGCIDWPSFDNMVKTHLTIKPNPNPDHRLSTILLKLGPNRKHYVRTAGKRSGCCTVHVGERFRDMVTFKEPYASRTRHARQRASEFEIGRLGQLFPRRSVNESCERVEDTRLQKGTGKQTKTRLFTGNATKRAYCTWKPSKHACITKKRENTPTLRATEQTCGFYGKPNRHADFTGKTARGDGRVAPSFGW